MRILNFTVRVEGATSSKHWDVIARRIATAARGHARNRTVMVFAGNSESWVLAEGRDPVKTITPKPPAAPL